MQIVQDHAREEGLDCRNREEPAGDQSRKSRNETGLNVLCDHRNKKGCRDCHKHTCNDSEIPERPVGRKQSPDRPQDLEAVRVGVELRDTAFRAVPVNDRKFHDLHAVVEGEDRHFRFDLEAVT